MVRKILLTTEQCHSRWIDTFEKLATKYGYRYAPHSEYSYLADTICSYSYSRLNFYKIFDYIVRTPECFAVATMDSVMMHPDTAFMVKKFILTSIIEDNLPKPKPKSKPKVWRNGVLLEMW